MMAAIAAADQGSSVCLIEKNEKLGKKLFITGKGRCNVTNAGDMDTLFDNVRTNGKFLYSAFYGYDNRAVMEFLERAGCPLKTERGGRVFPVSDHSSDVIAAFQRELKKRHVEILLNTEVKALLLREKEETDKLAQEPGKQNRREAEADGKTTGSREAGENRKMQLAGVSLASGKKMWADGCIVCTGGLSYPATGSTGDGYRFAEETGHKITECHPSLVPFQIKEKWCAGLSGLSLKNVSVRLVCEGREAYQGFGEMMFTHFGVSGPLILSASAHMRRFGERAYHLEIDLKPALDEQTLDRRLLADFEKYANHDFCNALDDLLPKKLIPMIIQISEIEPRRKVHDITREQRRGLLAVLKHFPVAIAGPCPVTDAIVTSGGVKVGEINPNTMESKIVKGLYFAGELIDVDAYTGGFNLQIAWATGRAAGEGAAAFIDQRPE